MSTLVVVRTKAIVEAAELKAAMETFGRVAKCEKHHTCPNMAFVTYEDAASAERAVAGGSSIMLGGTSIKVQADKRGGDGTPAAKPAAGVELPVVVVKDLRGDEAALRELMARFGKVEACVVHPSNPMLAFVTFDDLASARRALAGGTGLQLGDGGAAIRVERYRTSTGAAKGSFEAEKLKKELARAEAKAAAAEEALAASKLEAAAEIAELGKAVEAEAAEKAAALRAREAAEKKAAERARELARVEAAKAEGKKRLDDLLAATMAKVAEAKRVVGRDAAELRRARANLDVVFCIDATGSMAAHIAGVKDTIVRVATLVEAKTGLAPRFALVAYRDYGDDLRHEVSDFGSAQALADRLRTVEADGGGDGPEDCFGGLKAALQRDWKAPARLVMWVGDAPQHGRKYTTMYDRYPDGDPDGVTAEEVFGLCRSKGVRVVFCKLNNTTDRMIAALHEEARPFQPNLLAEAAWGGDLADFLTRAISHSASLTTTATAAAGRLVARGEEKRYALTAYPWPASAGPPEVSPLLRAREDVTVFTLRAYDGGHLSPLFDLALDGAHVDSSPAAVRVTAEPYARGEFRLAYCAHVLRDGAWRRAVLKESRYVGIPDSHAELRGQCLVQAAAIHLASEFTRQIAPLAWARRVEYVPVELLRMRRGAAEKWMVMEPFIDGEYVKYSSNNGYVNTELPPDTEVLHAFSHFTYHHSDGFAMVTDLQGAATAYGYLLTDPAIHTADPERLPDCANLGVRGMAAFFASHKCGRTCTALRLPLSPCDPPPPSPKTVAAPTPRG